MKVQKYYNLVGHYLSIGLTQKEIAMKLGFTEKTISEWVRKYDLRNEDKRNFFALNDRYFAELVNPNYSISKLKILHGLVKDERIRLERKYRSIYPQTHTKGTSKTVGG